MSTDGHTIATLAKQGDECQPSYMRNNKNTTP